MKNEAWETTNTHSMPYDKLNKNEACPVDGQKNR